MRKAMLLFLILATPAVPAAPGELLVNAVNSQSYTLAPLPTGPANPGDPWPQYDFHLLRFNSPIVDTHGSWDGQVFTAPLDGEYIIYVHATFSAADSGAYGMVKVMPYVNNLTPDNYEAPFAGDSAHVEPWLQVRDVCQLRRSVHLDAGDTVVFAVYTNINAHFHHPEHMSWLEIEIR